MISSLNQNLSNMDKYPSNQVVADAKTIKKTEKDKSSKNILVNYLVCAGRVIQDGQTKKFSYIDLFDVILIPTGNEFTYQSFFIAGKLTLPKKSKYTIEVKIIDPTKSVIATVSFGKDIELNIGIAPITALFGLVKVEKSGRHFIKISVNGNDLEDDDRFYFDVIKAGELDGKKE